MKFCYQTISSFKLKFSYKFEEDLKYHYHLTYGRFHINKRTRFLGSQFLWQTSFIINHFTGSMIYWHKQKKYKRQQVHSEAFTF